MHRRPNPRPPGNGAILFSCHVGRPRRAVPDGERSATSSTMRILSLLVAVVTFSAPALAQVEAIPTFAVTTNDVVQRSVMVFQMGGTNDARVTVKFAFTDTGAKRLEEFYRSHSVGQEVRYRIGSFDRVFKLDDRKYFGREGFWGLPERDAEALQDGLRGRK